MLEVQSHVRRCSCTHPAFDASVSLRNDLPGSVRAETNRPGAGRPTRDFDTFRGTNAGSGLASSHCKFAGGWGHARLQTVRRRRCSSPQLARQTWPTVRR